MNRKVLAVLLPCFFSLASVCSRAQPLGSGSSQTNTAAYAQYQTYFSQIGENAHLFNGSEYIRDGRKTNGFPFFESNDLLTGWVSYQGVIYQPIGLQYDVAKNQLITQNFSRSTFICLPKSKVDSFSIDGHLFVRLDSTNTPGAPRQPDFYERLTKNGLPVYEKKIKKMNNTAAYELPTYLEYNTYYLSRADGFHVITGKNDLLALLADKEAQLKKFIRSNKLNFKKRPEEAIARTVDYYSQLNFRP